MQYDVIFEMGGNMQIIKRDLYLQKLIDRRENGSIKIVTGIRRCGKSFLLFELFRRYLLDNGVPEQNIIALSLDGESGKPYRDPFKLYEFLRSSLSDPKQMYYVLLDEVQFAITHDELHGKSKDPLALYDILNELLGMRNVDVYVTGSNSKFLSTDVMTEFRGRGDEVRVYPLSFSEFMSAYSSDRRSGFAEYMLYGGLPQIMNFKTDEQKAAYLSGLFRNTYGKDVIERYDLRGDDVLDALVDILASSVGSLTNPKKLADSFCSHGIKTNSNTISSYIRYLQDAFVISQAKRYDIKGKRYIDTPSKYYFTDVGLRNARLNFRQVEQTHLLENIIYNELLARGFNVDVGVVEHRALDKNGKYLSKKLEVDFVCNKGYQRYYVQSAFAIPDLEKMKQEQAAFDRIDDSFKKVIVVLDGSLPYCNDSGYLIINALDFLLDRNSLNL